MKVCVIGLGKVGLPTACHLRNLGHTVRGYDISKELMRKLQDGQNPLPWEPGVHPENLTIATTLEEALDGVDMVYVIVPTPSTPTGLSSKLVRQAIGAVEWQGWSGLIVVGSTLDPRDADFVCSRNIAYSPPLIRLGHVMGDLAFAPVGLIGHTTESEYTGVRELWNWHWSHEGPIVIKGTPRTIAVAKLAINVSLSMRIAWANEIEQLCSRMGADADTVMKAVTADPRLGQGYMSPGWPPSGPCLPRDLEVWKTFGQVRLASDGAQTHKETQDRMLAAVEEEVSAHAVAPRVAVLGLVYNAGALDITNSQGVMAAERFLSRGWQVVVYDPAATHFNLTLPLAKTAAAAIEQANVVVIATPWPEFQDLDLKGKHVIDITWAKP